MREQGNITQADVMRENAQSAMEISTRILVDADPDYPTDFHEFM